MSKAYKRRRSKHQKVCYYDRQKNREAAALLRRGGYDLDEVAALLADIYGDESDEDLQPNEIDDVHLKKAKKRRAHELKVLDVDRHHLLYQRRFWSTDTYRELRSIGDLLSTWTYPSTRSFTLGFHQFCLSAVDWLRDWRNISGMFVIALKATIRTVLKNRPCSG